MKTRPAQLRQIFTYDRGSELACFKELSKRLNMGSWFVDPCAPWQRGSNENTNGLLSQFLPKGTDLSTVSQTWLNDLAWLRKSRRDEGLCSGCCTCRLRLPSFASLVERSRAGKSLGFPVSRPDPGLMI